MAVVSRACCPNHLELAERGCPSRSTFDNYNNPGIGCAHLAILAAAGGTPALRSIWATRPQVAPPIPLARIRV